MARKVEIAEVAELSYHSLHTTLLSPLNILIPSLKSSDYKLIQLQKYQV